MKRWRKEMGKLTQEQAAKLCGMTPRSLRRREKDGELTDLERYGMHYLWECSLYRTKPKKWRVKK